MDKILLTEDFWLPRLGSKKDGKFCESTEQVAAATDVASFGLDEELYCAVLPSRLGVSGVVNANERIYPVGRFITENIELNVRSEEEFIPAESGHPSGAPTLEVAARILNVSVHLMDGSEVACEQVDGKWMIPEGVDETTVVEAHGNLAFLKTQAGEDCWKLYRAGHPLGISSRSYGYAESHVIDEDSPYYQANPDHHGKTVTLVSEQELVTYDVVVNPSAGTYVNALEATEEPEAPAQDGAGTALGLIETRNLPSAKPKTLSVTEGLDTGAAETPAEPEPVEPETPVADPAPETETALEEAGGDTDMEMDLQRLKADYPDLYKDVVEAAIAKFKADNPLVEQVEGLDSGRHQVAEAALQAVFAGKPAEADVEESTTRFNDLLESSLAPLRDSMARLEEQAKQDAARIKTLEAQKAELELREARATALETALADVHTSLRDRAAKYIEGQIAKGRVAQVDETLEVLNDYVESLKDLAGDETPATPKVEATEGVKPAPENADTPAPAKEQAENTAPRSATFTRVEAALGAGFMDTISEAIA